MKYREDEVGGKGEDGGRIDEGEVENNNSVDGRVNGRRENIRKVEEEDDERWIGDNETVGRNGGEGEKKQKNGTESVSCIQIPLLVLKWG